MEGNNPRKILESLRNETECCICTEVYCDPRILPCCHTFCLKCLHSLATLRNKYPGQKMNCPICRQEFLIPDGGLSELKKNFFMERLVEMTEVRKKANSDVIPQDLCEACLEESDPESLASVPNSVMFCVDCQQKLCEECTIHHRKNKMTKLHNIVAIGSQSSVTLPKTFVPKSCSEHHKECLIFCENCIEVVCPLCFVEKHKLHNGSDVQKYLGDFATKVDDQVNILSVLLEESEKNKDKLEEISAEFNSKVAAVKLEINERAEKVKQLVDHQMEALLTEVDTFEQEVRNGIKFQKEGLEAHISGIKDHQVYCTNIRSEVSVVGVNNTLSNISETVGQLREKHQNQMKPEFSNPVLLFKPEDFEAYFTGERIIIGKVLASMSMQTNTGCLLEDKAPANNLDLSAEATIEATNAEAVQCNQSEEDVAVQSTEAVGCSSSHSLTSWHTDDSSSDGEIGSLPAYPVFVQSIRPRLSKEEKLLITGIAVLHDTLYIVHDDSSYIVCYELPSLYFDKEMHIDGLTNPCDVASDEEDGFLYVLNKIGSDDDFACFILKIDYSGDVLHKWSIGKSSGSLSVSESGDVIVAFHGKDVLKKYSSDGRLLSELTVALDSDSTGFDHAIEIEEDEILVCYESEAESGMHLVDLDSGTILESYSDNGCVAAGVKSPVHLAVDKRRNVFVVDKQGRRVLMFSNNMKEMTEILSSTYHIRYPYKIYLDCEYGMLFLVDDFYDRRKDEYKDSRVLVFNVELE